MPYGVQIVSLTLAAFLSMFVLFAVLGFFRPAWGVALYMLSFFACPPFWWWGKHVIGEYRWNLYGGVGLLIAVLVSKMVNSQNNKGDSQSVRRIIFLAGLLLVNATAVHFLLARSWDVSLGSYEMVAKFVLLFFLIVAAIRTPADFRIVILSMILGAGYLGWEATVNDRGKIVAGRLEGIGAPGARGANQLACLGVTILPLAGAIFLAEKWPRKLAMIVVTPLILNFVLLCSSRAAFLGLIGSAVAFAAFAPAKIRKQAIKMLCLGGIAVWLLMGDPQIMQRFLTTFVSSDEMDQSASSRIDYWKAGFRMIADYPLGAGGAGFKRVHGPKYIKEVNDQDFDGRAVHNGFINEACEWGVQGFLIRMAFIWTGLTLAFRTGRKCSSLGLQSEAIYGAAIISAAVGFLVVCVFGDRLDAEWGYWLIALTIGYARVFAPSSQHHFQSDSFHPTGHSTGYIPIMP